MHSRLSLALASFLVGLVVGIFSIWSWHEQADKRLVEKLAVKVEQAQARCDDAVIGISSALLECRGGFAPAATTECAASASD
jgi:hypothetical protein